VSPVMFWMALVELTVFYVMMPLTFWDRDSIRKGLSCLLKVVVIHHALLSRVMNRLTKNGNSARARLLQQLRCCVRALSAVSPGTDSEATSSVAFSS
jgi:uncharacterized membrane protein YwzB